MKDDRTMQTRTGKQTFRLGFLAGLLAGIAATGVMLLLNLFAGGVSLPEVFGSGLTALMPPPLFAYLHNLIGADAKLYLFYGIVVGQCLVFALSGGLYYLAMRRRLLARQGAQEAKGETIVGAGMLSGYQGLLLGLILWLFAGLLLLPVTGGGVFGANLATGLTSTMLSLAVVGVVFGCLCVFIGNWLVLRRERVGAGKEQLRAHEDGGEDRKEGEAGQLLSRRRLIRGSIVLGGVGLIGLGFWRFLAENASTGAVPVARLLQHYKSKVIPPPTPKYGEIHPAPYLSPEVTSNDQYYVVSKNLFADPTVDGGTWRLKVDGYVDHPFTLTYQDLLAMPMQQQYESMECVSNTVGGPYMSNALWEGVRLVDVLAQAGVKAGSYKVVFTAADDYSDSIHIEKALEPTTLVAVKMNGVMLPDGHGFPARMLVPGIYGMKHCKWLTHIEVVNHDYAGYWQQRGWSDAAPVRLTSRIDTPLVGANVPVNAVTYIAGVAFSGNLGIAEVDVSVDGAQTWQIATLKRPLSQLTWVLWELPWQPTSKGLTTLVVRAVDLEGNVQDPNYEASLPNGPSGYHSFDVTVV